MTHSQPAPSRNLDRQLRSEIMIGRASCSALWSPVAGIPPAFTDHHSAQGILSALSEEKNQWDTDSRKLSPAPATTARPG